MADSGHKDSAAAQMFGAFLDASPDALLALAGDGTITMANAAAAKLFGLARTELAGRHHRSLLSEGFRGEVEQLFRRLREDPCTKQPPR